MAFADNDTNKAVIEEILIDDYIKTGDHSLDVLVVNTGENDILAINLIIEVDGVKTSEKFHFEGVKPNSSKILTFSKSWRVDEGVHEVNAWISAVNGSETKMGDIIVSTSTPIASKIVRTRNSLIEVFTSSTCGPCKSGNESLHRNILPNISNYTVLKYQQNFPAPGDIYATGGSVGRRAYYGINSIPQASIDGQWLGSAGSMKVADFNGFQSKNSVLDISINYVHYDGSLIVLDAEITSETDIPTGDYRIHAVIYENKTTGNVGNNRETEFFQVVQKMVFGTGGKKVTSFTAGVPVKIQKGYSHSTTSDNIEEMSDLRMAIFVQDNSNKRIAQAFNTRIGNVSSVKSDKQSSQFIESLYPNPASTTAFIRYQLLSPSSATINVINNLGQVVYTQEQNATVGANDIRINLNGFESGVYRLLVSTENGMMTKNFSVVR